MITARHNPSGSSRCSSSRGSSSEAGSQSRAPRRRRSVRHRAPARGRAGSDPRSGHRASRPQDVQCDDRSARHRAADGLRHREAVGRRNRDGADRFGQIIGTPQYMIPSRPRASRSIQGATSMRWASSSSSCSRESCPSMPATSRRWSTRRSMSRCSWRPGPLPPFPLPQSRHQEGTRHGGGRPLSVDTRARSRLARRARTDAVAEPDTRTTIVERARPARRPPTPRPPPVLSVASSSRRQWLMTGVTLAAVVLISLVVRITLPFFRPTSQQISLSPVSTSAPPTPSVGGNDSSQAPPSAAIRSTETAPVNATATQPSTNVSMLAAARIVVLVERRAVEARQRPRVGRGNAPAPSRAARRSRSRACGRRSTGSRRASPSSRPARRSRSPGSPTSPNTGGASPAAARRA